MAYNPYVHQAPQRPRPTRPTQQQPQQQTGGAYGQNPFGQQEEGPKTFSIPTWLAWALGIGFLVFVAWLIWFLYF